MEEAKQRDLFCILCKLQFGKKLVFDLHLSLVHGEKVEIKKEAKSNPKEALYTLACFSLMCVTCYLMMRVCYVIGG